MSASRFVLLLLVAAVALALVGGCGGGSGTPEVSPAATSPWAGDYYSWSYNASIATFISVVRVLPSGQILVCGGGPILHGAWSGTGTVNAAGVATFTVPQAEIQAVWGGGKSDLIFTGTFSMVGGVPQADGKFNWKKFGSQKLDWHAKKLTQVSAGGTWWTKIDGVASKYCYQKCFAVLGTWDNKSFLVMAFEGGASKWPAESMIVVQDPEKTALNVGAPTFISALWKGNTKDTWYRHTQKTAEQPKVVMTARNLSNGGFVTGRVTGFLKKYDNSTKCVFSSAPISNVQIMDQVDLGE